MRYYLGVDWADQTHAVWIVDEQGVRVASRTVPHTAAGFSEWGRELDEWRAQGNELWGAIERPQGRGGGFLLRPGVVGFPGKPQAVEPGPGRVSQKAGKSGPVRAPVPVGL